MKPIKRLFSITGVLFLLVSLFRGINTFAGGELSGVEYYAVCRGLPANAYRTSTTKGTGTRLEIPQTESSYNIWEPSPVGVFNDTATSDTGCYFVCADGYLYENGACVLVTLRHDEDE